MRKIIILLIGVLLLVSCKTEIEYKGPEADPSLYVEALFDNDSVNYVFVGEATFFLKETNEDCLEDAVVTISVNGGEATLLGYDSDTALYAFPKKLYTGDTLFMTVTHPRLGSAVATAVVPPTVDMTIKEIRTEEKGKMYDNYAMIEFATADCRETDGYYFTFEPYVTAEIYAEMYDDEHYNPQTHQYSKEWQTIEYLCLYFSTFQLLAAETSMEEDIDIWNLIYGEGNFSPYQFDMKENKVECKVEFSADNWLMEYADSVRNVGFYVLMDVYSEDYTEFRQQCEKASSESNNPFVEPTQVKGNVMPVGDTRYAFGCFSVVRKVGKAGKSE